VKKIIRNHQKRIAHKISSLKKMNEIEKHIQTRLMEMLKCSSKVVSPTNLGFVAKVVNIRGKAIWFTKINRSKKWKRLNA
jgi:hypothetical protein